MAACIRGSSPHPFYLGVAASSALDRYLLFSAQEGFDGISARRGPVAADLFMPETYYGADGLMLARAEESNKMLDWATPQTMFAPLLSLHLLARSGGISAEQKARAVEVLATEAYPSQLSDESGPDPDDGHVSGATRLETCPWDVKSVFKDRSDYHALWWHGVQSRWEFFRAVAAAAEADPERLGQPARRLAAAVNESVSGYPRLAIS